MKFAPSFAGCHRCHWGRHCASPLAERSPGVLKTELRFRYGLLLDLEIDAGAAESDLHAPRGRNELDRHSVLVAHGGHAATARHRRARADGRVVAVEIVDAVQVVHLPGGLDLADADVADGETLHLDP